MNKAIQTIGILFFVAGFFSLIFSAKATGRAGVIFIDFVPVFDPIGLTIACVLMINGFFGFLISYWLPSPRSE